jgi:VWFA-related protein
MRAVAGALLALVAAANPIDQTGGSTQPPVFRARTDLVRMDVVVVDADGHVVRGLTKEDFQVVDRGRVRQLAAFEEITHAPAAAGPLPATLKRDVADNTAQSDRLIVLALDDLHFQAKTDDVKRMARRLVETIGSGASLALVTTSGTFGVEPTTDRAVLLAEIDAFLDRFDPEGRRLARGASMPAPPRLRNALGEPVAIRGPSDPARFFGDMGTFKSIEGVAKKIGADAAGRRSALVWISGGMNAPSAARCEADDRASGWYCGALAGLLETLGKSNVTAYSIATGDFSSTLLKDVANASGGFMIGADTFDRDMPRLVEDLDHYYLLGFYPDEGDRGYRTLDVRTARPGLTVRHRRGYDPGMLAARSRNSGPLPRLSEGALPNADLGLRMFAAPVPPEGRREARTVIAIDARVPPGLLADPDGRRRDTLRYEVWAVDLRRKKVVRSVAREARLMVDPQYAADARDAASYQVQTSLDLAPGRYQLRASAISAKTGKGGSVYLEVEVPDYRRPAIHVGPIVLRYADGSQIPLVGGGVFTGPPLILSLDRAFAAGERLRVMCALFQRARKDASVTVDVLTAAGDRARRLLEKRLDPKEPRMLDVRLDLAGLAPGGYRLRVSADDGTTAAEREIGFVVR